MLKRLTSATIVASSFSLFALSPASASCGLAGLLAPCPPTTPTKPPVLVPPVPVTPVAPLVVALPVAPAAPAPPPPAAQPQGGLGIGEAPGAAAELLRLVNEERAAARLPALQSRSAIVNVADRQSRAMANRGDIWHNDAYFMKANRTSLAATALGENVAMNGSLEQAHSRLMASPGHRANILNGRFDAVGISVVHDDSGALYITQDFVDSKAVPRARAKSAKRRPAAAPQRHRQAPKARSAARR